MNEDEIPTIGEYRGVKIHDFQSPDRIENVVRPAIDRVCELSDIALLFDFACDPRNPPEARLFAGAKCRAAHSIAASSRVQRPDIDLEVLDASTAGLDSFQWSDPCRYGSLLDPRRGAGGRDAADERPAEYQAEIASEEVRRRRVAT